MNKYERNLMFNITVMKVIYVLIIFCNLLLPIRRDVLFSISPLQIIAIIIWLFGLLGGMGYFDQRTPVLPIGILRFVEILYYAVLRTDYINWIGFGICVLLDIIFIAFLFFDKANYTYVKEDASNES